MWNLNLYKLVFGGVLFCLLTKEILGGVVVPTESSAQQEADSGSTSSGKSKNSQSKNHNSPHQKSHHNYNVQQIDLNITQPTVLVVHQLPSASSGLATSGSPINNPIGSDSSSSFKSNSSVSSETQTTTSSSGSDGSSSIKSGDLFSVLDAFTGSSPTTHTKMLSSEKSGSVEPDSSGNASSEPKSSSPSSVLDTGSSNSSEVSSSPKSPKSATVWDYLMFWIVNLFRKLFG